MDSTSQTSGALSVTTVITNKTTASGSTLIKNLVGGELKAYTAPSQIILCVTAEEAENYMRLQNKGPKYMLTLLPRDSESVILDALNSLQNGNTTF